MDSKRKVNGSSVDEDERAMKRRKVLSDNNIDLSKGETPETTTQAGLKLVDTLRQTSDKSGRRIATSFLTLPDKDAHPDYYQVIEMPIALDTIEAKLKRNEFQNLEQLESYFKRMISNAKEYNQRGSEIYDDSERLRKALSNVMVKINPAYTRPGYSAYPTPLPSDPPKSAKANSRPAARATPKVSLKVTPAPPPVEDDDEEDDEDEDAEGEPDDEAPETPLKRGRGRPPRSQEKSVTPVPSDSRYLGVGFDGLSFQQAQEKILEELIAQQDHPDDEYASFEVFFDKPDRREIPEYYKVIKHVVSLKSLQSRVKRSEGGKDAPTISEFKSWGLFEHEMSYLWNNAWTFNEDGSEIFQLATDLQTAFNKLLQEAKKYIHVPEPANKIKLKMSAPEPAPKITLKLGGRPSPADSPAPQTNGSNGTPTNGASRRNPFGGAYPSPVPQLENTDGGRSMSGSAASPTPSNSAVKNEDGARNSPALQGANYGYRAPSQAVSTPGFQGGGMPPPATPGLPNQNMYSNPAYGQSFQQPPMYQVPNPAADNKWRPEGQTAADALITNLVISTHPGLNISRHLRMEVPPSATLAQQSITITLPPTHYYLQIKPTVADFLVQPDRQHRIFVTSGSQRLFALPIIPNHAVDHRHPLFDARLLPGVNRIEIEIVANLPKGTPKPANGQDMLKEKYTVFANLLKG